MLSVPNIPRAISQMPPMAALAVFKKAGCSSDEIEALKARGEISAEKMRKITEYAFVMADIIATAPNGGVISGHEFVVMYGLAQACPLPDKRQSLMTSLELMRLYSDLVTKERELRETIERSSKNSTRGES